MSLIFFVLFSAIMMAVVLTAFWKSQASPRFIIGFLAFTVVISILAESGILRTHMIPLVPIVMVSMIALTVFYACSSLGTGVSKHFSLAALVGFQAFRFPLELILHDWANLKVIPETMTWTGQNWDVISGLLALFLAPFVNKYKALAWIFQVIGFALLLNVMRVVVFSLPLPFSWHLEIPLLLPFDFPYALIIPLFVWPAFLGHAILFRKLIDDGKS